MSERDDEADFMCPNCQTPWKCNGPHIEEQTRYVLSGRAAEDSRQAEQASRDAADGRALRRLREALPQAGGTIHLEIDTGDDHMWQVWLDDGAFTAALGDTIAEAADKFRAALEQR